MEKSEEGGIVMASSSRDIVIRVEHVNKLYGANRDEAARMMEAGASKDEVYKKTGCTVALWDVNLEIPRGEIFVIIGLSGSGKSTLVRCFNRLNKPTNGRILFDGRNLADMNQRELLQFRRNNISMVFQNVFLFHDTIENNIRFGNPSATEEEVIDYLFEKHPNVKGCFASNSDAMELVLDEMERKNVSPFIVGYDVNDDSMEALKAGKIDGLVVQNPFGMGYAATIASARAALNMGNEAFVNTGYVWVTKQNLNDEAVQSILN